MQRDPGTMMDNPYHRIETNPASTGHTETLEIAECWRLLETTTIARLAVTDDLGADIFPINYLAKNQRLFFRSAPGTKIVSLTRCPGVALEIDGTDEGMRFSVVVRGDAHRLNDDQSIHESGVDSLSTQTYSDKWNYFEVHPRAVTGIRFRSSRRAGA